MVSSFINSIAKKLMLEKHVLQGQSTWDTQKKMQTLLQTSKSKTGLCSNTSVDFKIQVAFPMFMSLLGLDPASKRPSPEQ